MKFPRILFISFFIFFIYGFSQDSSTFIKSNENKDSLTFEGHTDVPSFTPERKIDKPEEASDIAIAVEEQNDPTLSPPPEKRNEVTATVKNPSENTAGISSENPKELPKVVIAIIDTGFDLEHQELKDKLWRPVQHQSMSSNPLPWNPSDNQHLQQSVLGNIPLDDVLLYRSLKAKGHSETLSPFEQLWLKKKNEDSQFQKVMRAFKRQTHGTFVATIASGKTENVFVFPVRGLHVKIPPEIFSPEDSPKLPSETMTVMSLIEHRLKLSRQRALKKLELLIEYVSKNEIRFFNASYGVTQANIDERITRTYQKFLQRKPTQEELIKHREEYFHFLYQEGKTLLSKYPHILFTFSAGNDGQDNDHIHHFPSRIKLPHVISVAAINGIELAPFSNWGKNTVDIGAQGVGLMGLIPTIYSKDIPMNYSLVSGTSMASPLVANLAARCWQQNTALLPSQIKSILMSTVTEQAYLKEKLVSGGPIQEEQALKACSQMKN